MTPLADIIRRHITHTGPISLADYMELCLAHPDFGYYTTHDPLGAAGDFTTAPEISQMFGELIGLWVAQVWLDQGSPSPFVLAELGPGRGTLMADALRATRRVPGFLDAAQIWLVETSPALRKKQAENVAGAYWANTLDELPQGPLFLIANEFFDALPIRQFIREDGVWREKMVGLSGGKLVWGLAPAVWVPELDIVFPNAAARTVVEINPLGQQIAGQIGRRINQNGGAALIIDYGEWHGIGDTLQALCQHLMTDPFENPGQADLTAHINFSALAKASNLHAWPLQTQGAFLENLGIARRAATLGKSAPDQVSAAYHRLTDASEMGTLFKVMCLTRRDSPFPPGFTL